MTVELKCVDIDNFDEIKDFKPSFDEACEKMFNTPYHDYAVIVVTLSQQAPNQFTFTISDGNDESQHFRSYSAILTFFKFIINRLYANNIIDKYIGICKYSLRLTSATGDKQTYYYEKFFPVGFRKSHMSTDIEVIDCIFRQAIHDKDIDLFIKLIGNLNDNAFTYFKIEYSSFLFGQQESNSVPNRKYSFIVNNDSLELANTNVPVEFRAAFMSELRSRGIGYMEGDPML